MAATEETPADPTPDLRPVVLAGLFGLVSIPWTYGFETPLNLPLWPAFIASATYFAVGARRQRFLVTCASTMVGAVYGAATLWIAHDLLAGGLFTLSLTVGLAMALASLHAYLPVLSFVPGAFFGYATLFSVHAAGATFPGLAGLQAETVATLAAMLIGVLIAWAVQRATDGLVRTLPAR